MAKEKLITRTVITTNAEVMQIDTTTANVEIKTYTITGEYADYNAVLRVCKQNFETETLKIVTVQNTETVETLYGMPETKFIEIAEKLPPRKIYN